MMSTTTWGFKSPKDIQEFIPSGKFQHPGAALPKSNHKLVMQPIFVATWQLVKGFVTFLNPDTAGALTGSSLLKSLWACCNSLGEYIIVTPHTEETNETFIKGLLGLLNDLCLQLSPTATNTSIQNPYYEGQQHQLAVDALDSSTEAIRQLLPYIAKGSTADVPLAKSLEDKTMLVKSLWMLRDRQLERLGPMYPVSACVGDDQGSDGEHYRDEVLLRAIWDLMVCMLSQKHFCGAIQGNVDDDQNQQIRIFNACWKLCELLKQNVSEIAEVGLPVENQNTLQPYPGQWWNNEAPVNNGELNAQVGRTTGTKPVFSSIFSSSSKADDSALYPQRGNGPAPYSAESVLAEAVGVDDSNLGGVSLESAKASKQPAEAVPQSEAPAAAPAPAAPVMWSQLLERAIVRKQAEGTTKSRSGSVSVTAREIVVQAPPSPPEGNTETSSGVASESSATQSTSPVPPGTAPTGTAPTSTGSSTEPAQTPAPKTCNCITLEAADLDALHHIRLRLLLLRVAGEHGYTGRSGTTSFTSFVRDMPLTAFGKSDKRKKLFTDYRNAVLNPMHNIKTHGDTSAHAATLLQIHRAIEWKTSGGKHQFLKDLFGVMAGVNFENIEKADDETKLKVVIA